MRLVASHSHLHGLEHMLIRHADLWQEIQETITDAEASEQLALRLEHRGWQARALHVSHPPCSKPILDFRRGRIALAMPSIEHDSIASHLAAFIRDEIDVGIEILPMKSLQAETSSGPGYYEGELYNVIRNGRGVPSVPLVMIGVAP